MSNPFGRRVSSTFSGHPETWGPGASHPSPRRPRGRPRAGSPRRGGQTSRPDAAVWTHLGRGESKVFSPGRSISKSPHLCLDGRTNRKRMEQDTAAQLISGCVFRFPLSCLFPLGRVNPSQRAEGEGRGRARKRVKFLSLKTFRISTECPATHNCFKAVAQTESKSNINIAAFFGRHNKPSS